LRRRVNLERKFVERLKDRRVPGVIMTKAERTSLEQFYDKTLELRHAAKKLKHHLHLVDFPFDDVDWWVRWSKQLRAETRLANPATKGFIRADAAARRHAAKAAAQILKGYNQPLNVTRKGCFCSVAAILYGDPSADLFEACRAVKAADRNAV
jgi:hypothetical protein